METGRTNQRVPLVPLLIGLTAIVLLLTGGAVAVANPPWKLWGAAEPTAQVTACQIDEHPVPFPTEAGFAQVRLRVTNPTSVDQIYWVGVTVKDVAGQSVGTVQHRVGVPRHDSNWQTWRVTLTKPGGRRCEVTRLAPAT